MPRKLTEEQKKGRLAYQRIWNRERLVADNRVRRHQKRQDSAGRAPTTCDVCATPIAYSAAEVAQPAWDHNHGTGEFRGWLCNSCNTAIGLAGDNPALLRALAAYLAVRDFTPTRG